MFEEGRAQAAALLLQATSLPAHAPTFFEVMPCLCQPSPADVAPPTVSHAMFGGMPGSIRQRSPWNGGRASVPGTHANEARLRPANIEAVVLHDFSTAPWTERRLSSRLIRREAAPQ